MRVFNKDKTIGLTSYDLSLGHLEPDTLVTHHDAVQPIVEKWHYETVAEHPNGGKDVRKVVDVEGQDGRDAYDEAEEILVYIPYTDVELARRSLEHELVSCEEWLREHDYIGTKIATGRATVEDYAEEIAEMKAKAERIDAIRIVLEEGQAVPDSN